jgi:hypothetical protein
MKKIWINDGTISKKVDEKSTIPIGWKRGLIHKIKPIPHKKCSNTIWITDGTNYKRIDKNNDISNGWYRGNPNSKLKWVNNGIIDKRIGKNDLLKDGWVEGRLYKPEINSSRIHYTEKQWDVVNNLEFYITKYQKDNKMGIHELSEYFGFSHDVLGRLCREKGISYDSYRCTKPHRIISDYLQQSNIPFLENKKSILDNKFEIDIYIPNLKLGIEINGLYYHSLKDKNYHLNKLIECKRRNIELLQFWDSEILFKKNIVFSIIKNKTNNSNRVYARDLVLREIDNKTAVNFLDNNHIQSGINGSVNLGLFNKDDELISVMNFIKSRFSKNHEWELARFASKLNTSVIGGASKLFKYFVNTRNPKSIVTYSDKRIFNGNVYKILGFNFSHKTYPQYWYFQNGKYTIYNRMNFQKKKLKTIFTNFDEKLTENENMKNNGYHRVYDCGNDVWTWN